MIHGPLSVLLQCQLSFLCMGIRNIMRESVDYYCDTLNTMDLSIMFDLNAWLPAIIPWSYSTAEVFLGPVMKHECLHATNHL